MVLRNKPTVNTILVYSSVRYTINRPASFATMLYSVLRAWRMERNSRNLLPISHVFVRRRVQGSSSFNEVASLGQSQCRPARRPQCAHLPRYHRLALWTALIDLMTAGQETASMLTGALCSVRDASHTKQKQTFPNKLAPCGTDGRLFTTVTFLPSSKSRNTKTRTNIKNPARKIEILCP